MKFNRKRIVDLSNHPPFFLWIVYCLGHPADTRVVGRQDMLE